MHLIEQRLAQVSVKRFATLDCLVQVERGALHLLAHHLLGPANILQNEVVEEALCDRMQHRNLLGHGQGCAFFLLQNFTYAPATLESAAGLFVKSRAEPGEGLKFLELRVGELQGTGNCAVGRKLRTATHTRD